MSIQEIAMPKIKNITDDDDAYHPSNDPPPHYIRVLINCILEKNNTFFRKVPRVSN